MGKGQPNVSNSIRTLRFHAGEMTQAALAEKVRVTRQTIVAIEQGRYSPSLEVAFRIAHAFGVPLEEVKSGNNIAAALQKIVYPPKAAKAPVKAVPAAGAGRLAFAR